MERGELQEGSVFQPMMRMAWIWVLGFVAAAAVMAGDLGGTIRREGDVLLVRWTNVPPAFLVEHSLDLTNWHMMWLGVGQRTNESFEYAITNEVQATYMRLRGVTPAEAANAVRVLLP
jgi:hypothetical protein